MSNHYQNKVPDHLHRHRSVTHHHNHHLGISRPSIPLSANQQICAPLQAHGSGLSGFHQPQRLALQAMTQDRMLAMQASFKRAKRPANLFELPGRRHEKRLCKVVPPAPSPTPSPSNSSLNGGLDHSYHVNTNQSQPHHAHEIECIDITLSDDEDQGGLAIPLYDIFLDSAIPKNHLFPAQEHDYHTKLKLIDTEDEAQYDHHDAKPSFSQSEFIEPVNGFTSSRHTSKAVETRQAKQERDSSLEEIAVLFALQGGIKPAPDRLTATYGLRPSISRDESVVGITNHSHCFTEVSRTNSVPKNSDEIEQNEGNSCSNVAPLQFVHNSNHSEQRNIDRTRPIEDQNSIKANPQARVKKWFGLGGEQHHSDTALQSLENRNEYTKSTQTESHDVVSQVKARLQRKVEATRALNRDSTRTEIDSDQAQATQPQGQEESIAFQYSQPPIPGPPHQFITSADVVNKSNGVDAGRSEQAGFHPHETSWSEQEDFDPYDPPTGILRATPIANSDILESVLAWSESEIHDRADQNGAANDRTIRQNSADSLVQVRRRRREHQVHPRPTTISSSAALSSASVRPMPSGVENCLAGLRFYLAGRLFSLNQNEAKLLVMKYGGKFSTYIKQNSKTYVILGHNIGNDKLEFYGGLPGVQIIGEDGLFDLIERLSANNTAKFQPTAGLSSDKSVQLRVARANTSLPTDPFRETESCPNKSVPGKSDNGTIQPLQSKEERKKALNNMIDQPGVFNKEAALLQSQKQFAESEARIAATEAELLDEDNDILQVKLKEEEVRMALVTKELQLRHEKEKLVRLEESLKRQAEMIQRQQLLDAEHEKLRKKEAARKAEVQKQEAEDFKKRDTERAKANNDIEAEKAAAALRFRKAPSTSDVLKNKNNASTHQTTKKVARFPPDVPPYVTVPSKPQFTSIGLADKNLKVISKAAKSTQGMQRNRNERKHLLTHELEKYQPVSIVLCNAEMNQLKREFQQRVSSGTDLYNERRPLKKKTPAKKATTRVQRIEPLLYRVGGFIEEDSDSDQDALFIGGISSQQSPTVPDTKAKKKRTDPSPSLSSPPQLPSSCPSYQRRPATGGKQINSEAMKAYFDSLTDDISSASEDEEQSQQVISANAIREASPVCEEDQYHWAYQVWRKSWKFDEDCERVDWFLCGKVAYTSLGEANAAAGQEILFNRLGMAINPNVRRWSRNLDVYDMAHFEAELPNGYIQVKVDRFLHNRFSGQLPTSKIGWLKKTGWDIVRKTTTKVDNLRDDGSEEATGSSFEAQAQVEVVDGVYTILDEANRQAGELFLELKAPKASRRMDDIILRTKEQKRLQALFAVLDEGNEPFREIYVKNYCVTIEVYVQERQLKGPRNI
jgi:hypothetical protein